MFGEFPFKLHVLRISQLLILVSFASAVQAPASELDDVLSTFKKRYLSAQTLQLQFADQDLAALRGDLTLKRGNKFILDLGERSIICDGATIWNYQASQAKVVVDSYKPDINRMMPESIFLAFPSSGNFDLRRSTQSTGEQRYILSWTPNEGEEDAFYRLQRIKLLFAATTLELQEVEIFDGNVTRRWALQNIVIDAAVEDEEFSFEAPEGVRVIDLR